MNFNFLNEALIMRAEFDSFLFYNEIEKNKHLDLLNISSVYLPELERFQLKIIDDNNISSEDLNIELQLILLARKDPEYFNQNEFLKLFELCESKEDVQYNALIRRKLIESGLLEPSRPDKTKNRKEFLNLEKAYIARNLNEMYKFSMQLSNFDFKSFTKDEKRIILLILQVKSKTLALSSSLLLVEDKIHYGSWGNFWKTVSNYIPSDTLEENHFLFQKNLCIESDYCDERIDMSLFPNLSTIYDEENFYLFGFSEALDWTRDFDPHEIDFILAVAFSLSGASKSELIKKVDEYLIDRNNLK